MCVANFRGAVCSPPGVSNSGRPLNLILFRLSDQILNALNRSGTFQLAVINNGATARVVPAILHPAKTFRQDGNDISITYAGNNSAHSLIFLISSLPGVSNP